MEKVLFDGTFYNGRTPFHGGGEYGKAVLQEALERKESENCGIFFLKDQPIHGNIYDISKKKGIQIYAISDIKNIPYIVKKYGYTTIYSALPYRNWNQIKLPENVRFIYSFHGLRTMELAEMEETETCFYNQLTTERKEEYLYSVSHSQKYIKNSEVYRSTLAPFKNSKIITGSQHSKYSIYQHFPELQELDIEVLDDPMKLQEIDVGIEEESRILNSYGIKDNNYGLIISASTWYKNALRGVLAYDNIFEQKYKCIPDDYKVVVLGLRNKDNFEKRLKHPERFVLDGYVENTTLEVLYKHAHFFLFLSLSEGYGYPALEAMKYGTLCACSVNTSIAEVCQDMVLYFNPFLIEEISNRILQSFSDEIRIQKEKIISKKFPIIKEQQAKALKRIVDIIFGEE